MTAEWKLRGYVVEHLLGAGGSGEVWRARVVGSGEAVALKRIAVRDAAQLERAQAEATLLSALDHPHLVRLHGATREPDGLVLVLDLADGGSLADLLATRGRLTPGEVITAVAPVAAALAYLHDAGVTHGDVSAGNILFTAAGVPLLADLGVARLTGDDADAESTPAYIDPAVAAGCVPGSASDVFMLAAVALHALTGVPPWQGETATAALEQARAGALEDLPDRIAAADVPPAMAAVLLRALALDPHRRGTAADLALDLRHSGQPVAVELAAGTGSPDVAARPRGPRHAARPGALPPPLDDVARPAFERPGSRPPGTPAQPPTRLVAPRPRPVIPRTMPSRRRSRLVRILATLAVAAALAAGGWAWLARPESPARAAHASGRAGPAPGKGASAAESRPSTAAPARHLRDPTGRRGWRAELAELDAVRARAFATRDARLLTRVYASTSLLHADAALLARLVPDGCGLRGVHTRYTQVGVTAHGRTALLRVTATMPATVLICHGVRAGRAAALGPAALRLRLVRTAAGVRIADQRVEPGDAAGG